MVFYLVHTLHDYKSTFTNTHALLLSWLLLHTSFAFLGQNLSLQRHDPSGE